MREPGAPPTVLIYVQHLLGVGHLQRSIQLARALLQQGLQVHLVSGGKPTAIPLPGELRFHQLPSLHSADGSFTRLLDAQDNPIDDAWRTSRRAQLLEIFASVAPQVLITETFPFGRRMLRFELLPLLQAARDRCELVIASIRDILQPRSKPGREQETCEWLDEYYDHVLVHGDPSLADLGTSFSHTASIQEKLCYSGYICAQDTPQPAGDEGYDEVIVSAGGSATGLQLLTCALAARPLTDLGHLNWRLLVSPAISASAFATLRHDAGTGVIVERNRPDFSALIARARVSISQAGYNTVTDLLASNTAAVMIPYAEANEVEQSLRARALQRHGRIVLLPESELSAASLAASIDLAVTRETRVEVDLDGARNSAARIVKWLNRDEVSV